MIRIVGNIAGISLKSFSGRVRKGVPNRRTSSVFACRALNLIGGGSASPKKLGWELQQTCIGRLRERNPRKRGTDKSSSRGSGQGRSKSATGEVFHEEILSLCRAEYQ